MMIVRHVIKEIMYQPGKLNIGCRLRWQFGANRNPFLRRSKFKLTFESAKLQELCTVVLIKIKFFFLCLS